MTEKDMRSEPFVFQCCLEVYELEPTTTRANTTIQSLKSYGLVVSLWGCEEDEVNNLRGFAENAVKECTQMQTISDKNNIDIIAITRNKSIKRSVSAQICAAPIIAKANNSQYVENEKFIARSTKNTPGFFMTFLEAFVKLLIERDYKFCGIKEYSAAGWKKTENHHIFLARIALRRQRVNIQRSSEADDEDDFGNGELTSGQSRSNNRGASSNGENSLLLERPPPASNANTSRTTVQNHDGRDNEYSVQNHYGRDNEYSTAVEYTYNIDDYPVQIDSSGFASKETIGDGNCFFYALIDLKRRRGVLENDETAQTMRKAFSDWLAGNREYTPFEKQVRDLINESIQAEVKEFIDGNYFIQESEYYVKRMHDRGGQVFINNLANIAIQNPYIYIQTYADYIKADGEWVGNPELSIAPFILGAPVIVYQRIENPVGAIRKTVVFPDDDNYENNNADNPPPYTILYVSAGGGGGVRNHYESVIITGSSSPPGA